MNVTNGSIGTSQGNNSASAADNNGSAREEHVDLVLEHGLGVLDDGVAILTNTLTFTGENGLVDGKAVTFDSNYTAIGGDAVANMDRYDITGDQVVGLDARHVATVSDDVCFVGRVFLEGGDGFLGAALLRDTDDGVEDENGEDNSRVNKGTPTALVFQESENKGDSGGAEKNQYQLVLELLKNKLPQRSGRLLGDRVATIFGAELVNLLVSQTVVVIDIEVGEHLLDGCGKGVLHGVCVADEWDGQRVWGYVVFGSGPIEVAAFDVNE